MLALRLRLLVRVAVLVGEGASGTSRYTRHALLQQQVSQNSKKRPKQRNTD